MGAQNDELYQNLSFNDDVFWGKPWHGENSVKKTAEASVALLGAEQSPARFP